MLLHGFKNLLTQIVLLQKMPKRQDRFLIRDLVADQGDTDKAAHRRHLDQGILHRRITLVIPLLQQVDPQHGLQRVRRPATLARGLGLVGLDQLNQRFPRNNRLHLSQEALALGALFGRRLLIINVGEALRAALTELLGAHEASLELRLQAHSRAGWQGFPESPYLKSRIFSSMPVVIL